MDIFNIIEDKKIKITEMPIGGVFLRKQWEDYFSSHLSFEEKENIYLDGFGGFLWHLFSYEKREHLQGEEAEKAFNNQKKDFCYVFWQHEEYALILENANRLNSSDLEEECDIYIVDKGFNWTYVSTHERGLCGPYFSRRD